ncbi:MAG: hypothetical protein ACOCXD_01000 [Bacteroidota bacterium]
MKNWRFTFFFASILIIILAFTTGKVESSNLMVGLSLVGLLVAFIKTVLIIAIVSLAISITPLGFIIDLIIVIFTAYSWPILRFTWGLAWRELAVEWYWNSSTGSAIVVAAIIIAALGFLGMGSKKRRN